MLPVLLTSDLPIIGQRWAGTETRGRVGNLLDGVSVERYRRSVPEHVISFACPRLPSSRAGAEVCR
jgi:hypothetical protein